MYTLRVPRVFFFLFQFLVMHVINSHVIFAENQVNLYFPSETYFPPNLKGIAIYPKDFLKFDFYVESGDEELDHNEFAEGVINFQHHIDNEKNA